MARRPRLTHRLEHILFTIFANAGLALGARGGEWVAAGAAGLAMAPLRARRRTAVQQLRVAFPERDEAWARRTARASYAHVAREALAALRLARAGTDAVLRSTEVRGLDRLNAALAAGRGVVIVAGHFGNWEVSGAALAARGVPLDAIVQRQRNPLIDREIARMRERLGMRVIYRTRAPKEALRALRGGRAVAFVADQNAGRHGVFVPFFGRLASTHRGAALMALRTGAPVFLLTAVRTGDDRYEVALEAVETARDGELEAAVERLTAEYTAALELAIRAAPEQYFWVHRRWKTRPREEPAVEKKVP